MVLKFGQIARTHAIEFVTGATLLVANLWLVLAPILATYISWAISWSQKIPIPVLRMMMFIQEVDGMETKVRSTASKTPPTPPFQCRRTHNHPVKPKPRWSKDGRAIRSNPSPALGPWSKGMARSVDRVGKCSRSFSRISKSNSHFRMFQLCH